MARWICERMLQTRRAPERQLGAVRPASGLASESSQSPDTVEKIGLLSKLLILREPFPLDSHRWRVFFQSGSSEEIFPGILGEVAGLEFFNTISPKRAEWATS